VTTDQIKLAAKTLKEHEAKTGRSGIIALKLFRPCTRQQIIRGLNINLLLYLVVYMFHAEVDTCHSANPHTHEVRTKFSDKISKFSNNNLIKQIP